MQIVIDIPEDSYKATCKGSMLPLDVKNVVQGIKNGILLPNGHGKIGDLSELETRIGNFIEHYNHLLKETNPEALVYMHHILDGIIDTDTLIEADKTESEK